MSLRSTATGPLASPTCRRATTFRTTGCSDQVSYGYYTNRLVRTPDGWKIRTRKLTVTWNEGNMHIFELAPRRFDDAEGRTREKK
jgi:hypothetical protein